MIRVQRTVVTAQRCEYESEEVIDMLMESGSYANREALEDCDDNELAEMLENASGVWWLIDSQLDQSEGDVLDTSDIEFAAH